MIWYITRVIAAEIFNAIKDLVMCKRSGKCQTEKNLGMDCTNRDIDCEFDQPIQTVPDIDKMKLTGDTVLSDEAAERLLSDLDNGKYTQGRKDKGTY